MLPSVQVDRGAIKFVLSGANVMSPGLVSAGGKLPDPSKGEQPIKEGECVAIRAQGKNEILAVGVMKMDSEQVRKTGKGIAIENIHYLGGKLRPYDVAANFSNIQPSDRPLFLSPLCNTRFIAFRRPVAHSVQGRHLVAHTFHSESSFNAFIHLCLYKRPFSRPWGPDRRMIAGDWQGTGRIVRRTLERSL